MIIDVDQHDRLAQVAADGPFTLKRYGDDTVIVNLVGVGSGQIEKHVLAMYWLWNDGSQDRSGIQRVRFHVQRLGVQVFPALPQVIAGQRLAGYSELDSLHSRTPIPVHCASSRRMSLCEPWIDEPI